MFLRRLCGAEVVTRDPILARYRFTNVFRASDRVSQYLINHVIPGSRDSCEDLFFRIMLFKILNRVDTWKYLLHRMGEPHWSIRCLEQIDAELSAALAAGMRIYSAAYIIPCPLLGRIRKHSNHLVLLSQMMADRLPAKIQVAKSLQDVFKLLLSYPSLGPFLAFQFAIDINYSRLTDFSEMDFVVAGPGAVDGIQKCFAGVNRLQYEDIIRAMVEMAPDRFEELGIPYPSLWGRELQLIDCQNVFCEVAKYCRVAHPQIRSCSGRTRIKQLFVTNREPLTATYPSKWRLNTSVVTEPPPLTFTLPGTAANVG